MGLIRTGDGELHDEKLAEDAVDDEDRPGDVHDAGTLLPGAEVEGGQRVLYSHVPLHRQHHHRRDTRKQT